MQVRNASRSVLIKNTRMKQRPKSSFKQYQYNCGPLLVRNRAINSPQKNEYTRWAPTTYKWGDITHVNGPQKMSIWNLGCSLASKDCFTPIRHLTDFPKISCEICEASGTLRHFGGFHFHIFPRKNSWLESDKIGGWSNWKRSAKNLKTHLSSSWISRGLPMSTEAATESRRVFSFNIRRYFIGEKIQQNR